MMHRLALAAAVAALASASCATREGVPAREANQTRAVFERNCAVCHGPRGEGRQVGTLTVPPLREGRAATDPDERLFAQIRDGGNGMPPFKFSLTDDQIQDLVRFVREEIQGRASPER
jgi:mono/diheme cytochrome c family protein